MHNGIMVEQRYRKKAQISNYNLITKHREDGYDGTAIYLRNDFKYKTNQRQYDNEIQITELTIIQNQINITSIYASPTTNCNKLKSIIGNILNDPHTTTKTVIAADLNTYHSAWRNPYDDRIGKMLIDKIEGSNFVLLHENEITFVPTVPNKRATTIDLTIITENLIDKFKREVLEHHMGATHHRTIIATIQGNTRGEYRLPTTKSVRRS